MSQEVRIRLCSVSDVPVEGVVRIVPDGLEALAVFNLGGRFYALSDTCSHGMASLSEGEIDAGRIVCPYHAGSFDIATGQPVDRPCVVPVSSYPVEVHEGELWTTVR